MIRDAAKIIVTPTGVSLKEALTEEVVKALNEEASIYMNYESTGLKLCGILLVARKAVELGEC